MTPAVRQAVLMRPRVVRGMSQGMSQGIQGFNSPGTSYSTTLHRSRHISKRKFSRSKVLLPTFSLVSTGNRDEIELPHAYDFQVAIEVVYTDARTGIATNTRYRYTFSGSPTASYNGTNDLGYIESDWLYHPEVPAGTAFGLWTVVECPSGVSSANRRDPYIRDLSNLNGRFEGYNRNATGQTYTDSSYITSNAVLTQTSVSVPAGDGISSGFTPCALLIDYGPGDIVPAIWGDSISYGTGEGTAISTGFGDKAGDAYGNYSYWERGLYRLGLSPAINISKGGDGYRYSGASGAILTRRLNLLARVNPTHVCIGLGHNDVFLTQATFRANAVRLLDFINAALPNAPLVHSTITPDATSTDSWATTANQTATANFGGSGSFRGLFNADIRSGASAFGRLAAVFDINLVIEAGYDGTAPSETSKWVVDGTANYATSQATHPNSRAYDIMQASLTLAKFGR